MKVNTILKTVLVFLGLALSAFLAIGGDRFPIPTPGVLAARAFVPPRPYPNQLQSLGNRLRLQMFVDWIFWLALMSVLYLLTIKLSRRAR